METWSIKEMAARTKLSENTLRFYEKEGLIHPKRGDNGYRYYSLDDFTMLQYIIVMKYAHFSLKEIKHFLNNMNRPVTERCNAEGRELLERKVAEIQETIRLYQKIIVLIENLPTNQSFEEIVKNYDAFLNENNQFIHQIFESIIRKGE